MAENNINSVTASNSDKCQEMCENAGFKKVSPC